MEGFPLIWILPIATFALVMVRSIWSKKRTEARIEDPDAPKSLLAREDPGPQPIRGNSQGIINKEGCA